MAAIPQVKPKVISKKGISILVIFFDCESDFMDITFSPRGLNEYGLVAEIRFPTNS
jgi:hypothetical protein